MDKYDFIYKKAKDVYSESTTGGGRVKPKKEEPIKIETSSNFNKAKPLKKEKSINGLPPNGKKPSSSSIHAKSQINATPLLDPNYQVMAQT